MYTLVINSGSSSLKYKVFIQKNMSVLAEGIFEEIGSSNSKYSFESQEHKYEENKAITNHEQALTILIDVLTKGANKVINQLDQVTIVGHRVVHGGEKFTQATQINDKVIESIKECISLAPLHNPANIAGIESSIKAFKEAKQIAVFDTAFFQQMPKENFLYPLPKSLYTEHNIRKYGFHGTSHSYVTKATASYISKEYAQVDLISVHLGNGCSMSLIKDGVCIDTTLGMTPLDGLMMGTRCGSIDPAIVLHLQQHLGMTPQQVDELMNKKSGLKGIARTSDMRELEQMANSGDQDAQLAIRMYVKRVKETLAKYLAYLPECDGIIFTAGIGENSSMIRELVLTDLEHFGIELDMQKNLERSKEIREINKAGSKVKVFVAPTNEELEIAILAQTT